MIGNWNLANDRAKTMVTHEIQLMHGDVHVDFPEKLTSCHLLGDRLNFNSNNSLNNKGETSFTLDCGLRPIFQVHGEQITYVLDQAHCEANLSGLQVGS